MTSSQYFFIVAAIYTAQLLRDEKSMLTFMATLTFVLGVIGTLADK